MLSAASRELDRHLLGWSLRIYLQQRLRAVRQHLRQREQRPAELRKMRHQLPTWYHVLSEWKMRLQAGISDLRECLLRLIRGRMSKREVRLQAGIRGVPRRLLPQRHVL